MKIRTDFVTNSSSSGFVLIRVAVSGQAPFDIEREYDTGYGGYIWNGFDKKSVNAQLKSAKSGKDILEVLRETVSDFDRLFIGKDKAGKAFLKALEGLDDLSQLKYVALMEDTHFDTGGKDGVKYVYQTALGKKSLKRHGGSRAAFSASRSDDRNAKEWLRKYGHLIAKAPQITIPGSTFVLSGCESQKLIDEIEALGGKNRQSVSGLTNYLVVEPVFAGNSKAEAVIAQRAKGKQVEVVLVEALEDAMDALAVAGSQPSIPKP